MTILRNITFDHATFPDKRLDEHWNATTDGGLDSAVGTTGDGLSGGGANTTSATGTWTDEYPINCVDNGGTDGTGYGGWACPACGGNSEQIITAANYSLGGGGKGLRHWISNQKNNNSGGLRIKITPAEDRFPELWVRWYSRFEAGVEIGWNIPACANGGGGGNKMIYFNSTQSYSVYAGYQVSFMRMTASATGTNMNGAAGTGWEGQMAGMISDGQWRCYEVHLKANTSPGATDGIGQFWVNGTLIVDSSTTDYGTTTGWTEFLIPSNGGYHTTRDYYQDVDDIVVSDSGYIGLLDSVPTVRTPNRSLR
jgi:hypothetical protein